MKKLVSGYGTGGIRTRESLRFARFQGHGTPAASGDDRVLTSQSAACASVAVGLRDGKEGSADCSPARVGHTFRASVLDRALARPRGFIAIPVGEERDWAITVALSLLCVVVMLAAVARDEREAAREHAELEQCRAAVTGCRNVAAGRPGLCWVPGEPGVEVAP